MLRSYLTQLKAKSGLSWAQIEQRSGVPIQTIQRIFNGSTPNPGFETVLSIISAMGGSLGDIGQNPDAAPDATQPSSASPHNSTASSVAFLQAQIADLKRTRLILEVVVGVVIFVILFVLILDVTNGGIGYIRY